MKATGGSASGNSRSSGSGGSLACGVDRGRATSSRLRPTPQEVQVAEQKTVKEEEDAKQGRELESDSFTAPGATEDSWHLETKTQGGGVRVPQSG